MAPEGRRRVAAPGAPLVIVQEKDTVVAKTPSEAVAVTVVVPVCVGVPLMKPVAAATVSPAGRPVAVNRRGTPSGSTAARASVRAWPTGLVCGPGLLIVGRALLFLHTSGERSPSTPVAEDETAKQYVCPAVAFTSWRVTLPTSRRCV